jgi:prevent-host-death family protein
MNRIIGVTELQRRFRSVFDEVVKEKTSYILTRGSRPEAVIIPYDDYLRTQKLNEAEVLARFDSAIERMRQYNSHFSDEEIEADIEAAIREVREGRIKAG